MGITSLMVPLQLICNQLVFINWLQNHLISCPFKYLTGIDCPGCGFQRAIIALIKGDLRQSFTIYPPAIPLLIFFTCGLAGQYFKLDNQKGILKKTLFMLVGTIVLFNYGLKIWGLYNLHPSLAVATR